MNIRIGRPTNKAVIRASLIGLVLLLTVGYVAVACQMAAGVTVAKRTPLTETPTDHGLPYEDVVFSPRDADFDLRGWFIDNPDGSPVVLFVHGIDSNREPNLGLAARLYEAGYDSLMIDMRGHGESDDATTSGGYFEKWDVLGAYDYLRAKGYEPDEIAVISFSMGAATSILAVAEEPEIVALVADSPFADINDMIAQETARRSPFPEWLVPVFIPGMNMMARLVYGIDLGESIPQDAVERIEFPVFLIHGTGDTRIGYQHSERIFDNAFEGSELWIVEGVEHTQAFTDFPDEYEERLLEYLETRLAR
jgi:pimeloyl-ACP methyl ester carboxylesterase